MKLSVVLLLVFFFAFAACSIIPDDIPAFLRELNCNSANDDDDDDRDDDDRGDDDRGDDDDNNNKEKCDILIVGGGWGGLHSAYVLSKHIDGCDICIIEAESELGGRVSDNEGPNSSDSDWRVVGACPVRFQESQTEMRCLMNELGVDMELSTPETLHKLMRGYLVSDTNDFAASGPLAGVYEGLPDPSPYNCGLECDLYDYLRGWSDVNPLTGENDPAYATCADYPNVISYCQNVLSPEACAFLKDSAKHQSDWNSAFSPCDYYAFLNNEWFRCCSDFYPRGGHSQAIKSMEQAVEAAGVRIFKDEAVQCIKQKRNDKYKVSTTERIFVSPRLIMAVPKDGMNVIGGPIGEQINDQPEVQAMSGVPVFTLTVWWPTKWWASLQQDPFSTLQLISNTHCFSRSEFYGSPYLAGQYATRAVYTDDPNCVKIWKNIMDTEGEQGLVKELLREYADVLPGVSIPQPVAVEGHHIDNAVYFQRNDNLQLSNIDIEDWAVAPLGSAHEICMVGEGWHPEVSAWARGAVLSSLRCLRERFDDLLPADFEDSYECLAPGDDYLSNEYVPDYQGYQTFPLANIV